MNDEEFTVHRSIPSIRTEYRGRFFRSRLEARWAVFFDLIGIEFQYEREHSPQPWAVGQIPPPRLVTSSDTGETIHPSAVTRMVRPDWPSRDRPLWYLPDFYLPKQDLFIETKPLIYEDKKVIIPPMQKQQGLAILHHQNVVTLCGCPAEVQVAEGGLYTMMGFKHTPIGPVGGWTLWCKCHACGTPYLTDGVGGYSVCPGCNKPDHYRELPEIQQALRDARLWHFLPEEEPEYNTSE